MANEELHEMIVALDIGTSKVVALVGEIDENNKLNVVGIGKHPSRGMKKGVVVNIDATIESIQRAVEEAELMAGVNIQTVYTGIAGSHIRSMNSHGVVAIKDKEVTEADVDRVMDAARAIAIPADQRILHVLPQEFIIDDQDGIREPIGMSGVRMEANVHMVTGSQSAAHNIVKCVERCGLEVDDIILEQVASSHSVLQGDEKELGVCIVDIGGGTSDIAVFLEGAIHHTAVIPVAGDQVTNDIAIAIRTPTSNAETIKLKHGTALRQMAEDYQIEVPGVGEREPRALSTQTLASVIEPRYEELFLMILDELRRSGYDNRVGAGIVLTGGSSTMPGVVELAEEVFHMPVRIGTPRDIGGLKGEVESPMHATGVGLLLFGAEQQAYGMREKYTKVTSDSLWVRMKRWFSGNL
ncbi:MAG: Cell division protein FtsA [uncultured Thiotrichaceae bacterium]|uniref:Cell division protein FtsA n=1 Tax=uncultured Thiotrichaceae bacterium TaxID=298394 RepID=A0A6S6T6H6_9GAMM|nr:MAG: Cell division protein FtsA [uncultured Thiotrichaceae bacterium]